MICKRCGRKLKKNIEGFGPVCYKKSLLESNCYITLEDFGL